MAQITAQQALYILLSQSAEFAPLNLPRHERADLENHARFLNAVVSFLRTEPGQVLALSMEVTGTHVFIDVAGNRPSDVSVTPSLNQIIKDLWNLMKRVAATVDKKEHSEASFQLSVYLITKHWKVMQKHFRKGESMCRQFFEHIDSDPQYRQLPAPVERYLAVARAIYNEMAGHFKGNHLRSDTDIFAVCARGNLLRRKYWGVKNEATSIIDNWLGVYESAVGQNANASAAQQWLAPGKRFTLVRYIEKLISPFDHVFNVHRAATKAPIADILRSEVPLQLDVSVWHPEALKVKPAAPLKPVLVQLLEDLKPSRMGFEDEDEKKAFEEIVQKISDATLNAIAEESTILPSHCECFLLLHHLVHDRAPRRPLPYIAVSKLSCLQCALYFEGYEEYRTGQSPASPPISIRGCHHEVVVCLLPSQTSPSPPVDPMDAFIGDYIIERVKGWLRIVIREQVEDWRRRRDSQSTGESPSSSDDDDIYNDKVYKTFAPDLVNL